nr:DUF6530 family protein [bacterium]
MKAPTDCKHQPLVSVNDYDSIDGQYANYTDAKALSIGFAQYNKPGLPIEQRELSLKVWRHTGDQWSPQSEELPFHRNLDLTILLLDVLLGEETNSVSPDWKISGGESEKQIIQEYYKKNKKFINPRFKKIKELL